MSLTPNHLTAIRILIAFLNPILLITHRSFGMDVILFFTFTAACITDWLDGYLARTRSLITTFGKIADPIADKLLILGSMGTFAFLRLYSFEWLVPIVLREGLVTGARLIFLKKGKVIPAESAGKIKVGFQIGSIYATIVFLLAFDSGFFYQEEPVILFFFQTLHYVGIFLAVVVTIWSGVIFFHRLNQK